MSGKSKLHADLEQWREVAREELGGADPGELGWDTPEGLRVKPLYTAADLEQRRRERRPAADGLAGAARRAPERRIVVGPRVRGGRRQERRERVGRDGSGAEEHDRCERIGGVVVRGDALDPVRSAQVTAEYEPKSLHHKRVAARLETAGGERLEISGEVVGYVPLRNRRGGQLTHIGEGMTEWRCGDRIGYGLSEFLRQVH